MRALHYQQIAQPFPNANAPLDPMPWLACGDDRPVPARWRPPYDALSDPIKPPESRTVALSFAALHQQDERPHRKPWRAPSEDLTLPVWEPHNGNVVTDVSSWQVEQPRPTFSRSASLPSLFGAAISFVPLSPPPEFSPELATQDDQVFYRADATDMVYIRPISDE